LLDLVALILDLALLVLNLALLLLRGHFLILQRVANREAGAGSQRAADSCASGRMADGSTDNGARTCT
jgi:hypothetical protein